MMTTGPDSGRPYGNSRIAAIMRALVSKWWRENFESVSFAIPRHRKIDEVVSSPGCQVKMTEALLENDKSLKPVAHVVNTAADRVTEVSSRRAERIARNTGGIQNTVSVCLSSSSEAPPTDIHDDTTYKEAYLIMDFNEEERHWRKWTIDTVAQGKNQNWRVRNPPMIRAKSSCSESWCWFTTYS